MRSENEHNDLEGAPFRELRLLEEVDRSSELSQRHLASRLGVALGVTNLLVRNLAKKGYIRVTQVGWRRWAYVMTPAGIVRKVNLTIAYIERFLDHYRRVRDMLREEIGSLDLNAESQIAICGTTELAELTYLALRHMGVSFIDVYAGDSAGSMFLGMPVKPLESLRKEDYAKVLVADSEAADDVVSGLERVGVSGSDVVVLLRNQTAGDARIEAEAARED